MVISSRHNFLKNCGLTNTGMKIELTVPRLKDSSTNTIFENMIFPLSDTMAMDLRYYLFAIYVIMLGGGKTHPWSATKGETHIPATIPVAKKTTQTNKALLKTNKLLIPTTISENR